MRPFSIGITKKANHMIHQVLHQPDSSPQEHKTEFSIVRQDNRVLLHCPLFDKCYHPHEVFYCGTERNDSEHSDPGDESVTYYLQTIDNVKGHIVDGYAIYGDMDKHAFIIQLERL